MIKHKASSDGDEALRFDDAMGLEIGYDIGEYIAH